MLEVTNLKRKFIYNDKELEDIEGLSLKEIKKSYSGIYPELINGNFEFKEIKGEFEIYHFSTKVGLNG